MLRDELLDLLSVCISEAGVISSLCLGDEEIATLLEGQLPSRRDFSSIVLFKLHLLFKLDNTLIFLLHFVLNFVNNQSYSRKFSLLGIPTLSFAEDFPNFIFCIVTIIFIFIFVLSVLVILFQFYGLLLISG